MNLKCLIVDDEPISREILKTYISQVPYLNLAGEFSNAFDAMKAISIETIDLIFLDINMPRLTGLDMLRAVKKYPAVIITSAYPEYALEGFELSVTDYLLKPFSFPRFVQAAVKVLNQRQSNDHAPASIKKDDFLIVKTDKKLVKLYLNEISYIEAYGNYILIYCGPEKLMSRQTLTQFEEQLPENDFIRIHKSYIVSVKAIKFFEGNEISIGNKKLPIGKVYKDLLLEKFNARQ